MAAWEEGEVRGGGEEDEKAYVSLDTKAGLGGDGQDVGAAGERSLQRREDGRGGEDEGGR